MTYVKNADLTLEYIVRRAFRLGAESIYTDLTPGNHRSIVMCWPSTGPLCYAMEDYKHNGWPMGFQDNLPGLRKSVEVQGYLQRLQQPSENRLEQQAQAVEEQYSTTCINCLEYAKTKCDGCKEPLCFDCNRLLNVYGPDGDGLCWKCREKKAGTYDGD